MRTTLPHVNRKSVVNAAGERVTYYWHRKTKRKIQGEPGTEEFHASYQAAAAAVDYITPGTITALVRDYRASDAFTKLATSSQTGYNAALERIRERFGHAPLSIFEDKRIRGVIRKWRDDMAKTSPRSADYAVTVLGRIIRIAYNEGQVTINHAAGIGQVYRADRSENIWLPKDVSAFMASAGPPLRLALRLALDTGQRQGDLVRLTWTAYQDGRINVRQSKGGRRVSIPVTQLLTAALDDAPRGDATTILINSKGRPWTQDGFRTSWGKATKRAGITDLTFHDLRGTAITRLWEAGCTDMEIASITGHDISHVTKILERYTARTAAIADNAIAKLEAKR